MPRQLSATQARRIALGAQGFRDPRPSGAVDRRHLRRLMGRLGLLQLDSVPAIIRTQYLPLFSRLGPYRAELLDEVAYRHDEWFETWCHEASLMAVADEPLLRWRKQRARQGETWRQLSELAEQQPGYVDDVLAQVAERPRAAGELDDPRRREGEWWGSRSDGAVALDWLFRIGEVGIRRRPGFVKEFDLLERIVPSEVISQPTPSEADAQRELLRRAAQSLGVGTADDLVDYHRLPKRDGKQRLAELLENGELETVDVEGWDRPGLLDPAASTPRAIDACTFLSPFDPVVWFRPRAERLFNFSYKLEIYTPAAKRVYGYYVLPLLRGDTLIGRVDAKTDRQAGVLRVFGAFAEPGVPLPEAAESTATALSDLAAMVGADRWSVDGHNGDLIGELDRIKQRAASAAVG